MDPLADDFTIGLLNLREGAEALGPILSAV